MQSVLIAVLAFVGYIVAYHTYGKFLSKKIFRLDFDKICPSQELRDDLDYIPTKKTVLFGHHFTSIAGLGPIVGPAVGVIWGWVPALIWIFFGSIFMGAVHDFGSLVVSLRGRGRSIGELSSDIINPRVRTLFLLIIFFELWIVIAIFSLIIAILFNMYPASVFPVWIQIPIAMVLGHLVYKKNGNPVYLGLGAMVLMYFTIVLGAYFPFTMPAIFGLDPLVIWIVLLLLYVFFASTLPVQVLLQPRDFINSYQLLVAMALLFLGVMVARPEIVAPATNMHPNGAPSMWPFLFVVIACGAISGFHSLVSSGTSSKQCAREKDALFVGYGSMLTEGMLSVLVILAVAGGLGLGLTTKDGLVLQGVPAFSHQYASWAAASGLGAQLGAFVTGAANMIATLHIPVQITLAIMGVFLVSFACTSLDTATRIQRYVITELAEAYKVTPLIKPRPATLFAVFTAFVLAFYNGSGKGALTLWPLFGAVNQLLAGLALLVVTIYLAKRKIRTIYTAVPMVFMIAMTGWAMVANLQDFFQTKNWLLVVINLAVMFLEFWMVVESALVIKNLTSNTSKTESQASNT